jgi:zinc transport system substrate-binding protein
MRRLSIWTALILSLALLAGCSKGGGQVPGFAAGGSGKVKVAASFYPVYEFARAVGGDRIDALYMVPAGTEPHDWEPTPRHIQMLNEANLFIYSGAGMEHWVDKTIQSLDNKAIPVVEASAGFDLIKGAEGWDPHVWLDPLGVVHEVERIRDGLIKADPAGQATYEANASAYIAKLKALDQEFKAGLSQCGKQQFYTTHAAFGYLARRYRIDQHPIMGLTPDAEPKPRELAAIVADARQSGIKYIFFETLVSDKVAKMVAQEIGAKTLVLNPFEGLTAEEIKAGMDYLSVMRANLTNLKTAMECGK